MGPGRSLRQGVQRPGLHEVSAGARSPPPVMFHVALPLHTVTMEELLKAPADRQKCAICLEEYRTGETQATLPCFHQFHNACAEHWLLQSTECPICKHKVWDCDIASDVGAERGLDR